MGARAIDHARITPSTPLRLEVAVEVAFPTGGMTVAGLRREAAKGRLAIERIAGKDFTTLQAIEEMRRQCHVQARERASTSSKGASARRSGTSETATTESARAALRAMLKAPKERSRSTSTKNGNPGSKVVQLPSRT